VTDRPATFDDFVVSRGPALLRFAYVLTGDGPLAEDLVQEALVKAHRRWAGRQRLADHPEAYVRRIVVNQYVSWRRRRASTELPGRIPERPHPDSSDALAAHDEMWRLLAGLPHRQRAVLVLRYYEALPDGEIAEALGCAEATVRSLAFRAFDTLRRHPHLLAEHPAPNRPREGT
jgi:RNA polymerase sigma-70 factor (sigma-E family)